MKREGLTTEYKREYTDDIKKTVISFANTDGGEILIGVDNLGEIVGIENPDETMLQVTNAIRDAIRPDVTMFVLCEVKEVEGQSVVSIHVQKGTACPYYLANKGLRPEGVFIRQGSSTAPATESAILKMIRETGGDNYETTRSLKQELTFIDTEKVFSDETISFEKEQQRSLGVIGTDGAYSNLGLLLSDQCMHTVKIAIFEGDKKTVFKDRAEFSGALLKQIREMYEYIDRYNRTRAEFSGLKRVDLRDYPPEAVRETLLNAIIHRDYSYSGSTLISIYDNRIEFVSLGGLPTGISYDDILLGVSIPRNNKLAEIFYRLKLIEAYGTGIPKITESYRDAKEKPIIEVSDHVFKITLPNMNFQPETNIESYRSNKLSTVEEEVMNYLVMHDYGTRQEIQKALDLSQSKAIRTLKTLSEKNLVESTGGGRTVTYSAKKK